MGPAIRVGDVVITKDAPPDEELGTQTVVTFDDPANGEQVLHRIIEVTPDGYRTKGDANASADAEIVDPTQVRGAGLMLAPYVGYAAVWVQEAAWPQLVALLVALAALAAMSRQTWMWSAGR
jgi:signal peptidase